MSKKRNNSSLKIIVIILVLLLVCIIGWIGLFSFVIKHDKGSEQKRDTLIYESKFFEAVTQQDALIKNSINEQKRLMAKDVIVIRTYLTGDSCLTKFLHDYVNLTNNPDLQPYFNGGGSVYADRNGRSYHLSFVSDPRGAEKIVSALRLLNCVDKVVNYDSNKYPTLTYE